MTFPFARILYELVMYSFILVIGALVGMEIPILTTLLSQKEKLKDSIANVMSLDYLGALVGSVAFPLLLLPSLGLLQSSFIIGLINIIVAIVNVFIFRDHLVYYRQLLGICAGIFNRTNGIYALRNDDYALRRKAPIFWSGNLYQTNGLPKNCHYPLGD